MQKIMQNSHAHSCLPCRCFSLWVFLRANRCVVPAFRLSIEKKHGSPPHSPSIVVFHIKAKLPKLPHQWLSLLCVSYFRLLLSQGCQRPLVIQEPMMTSLSSSHFSLIIIWLHSLPDWNLFSSASTLPAVHWLSFNLFGHLVFLPVSEVWRVSAHG